MDKLVTALEQLTQEGLTELTIMDAKRLSDFMEQRGMLMQELIEATEKATFIDKRAYKARIQSILSLDPIFLKKLEQFREEARLQLGKIDNGKTQRNAYDNAYDNESYFFDRKK